MVAVQVGNEQMTLNLEWGGADAFRGEPLREWSVRDRAVGVTRGEGQLAFATVRGAGHMVRVRASARLRGALTLDGVVRRCRTTSRPRRCM